MIPEDFTTAGEILCSMRSVPSHLFEPFAKPATVKPRNKRKHHKKNINIDFPTVHPHGYILLPNSDHRFNYPTRLVNHLLGGDFKHFKSTLDEFCVADVVFKHHYDGAQNPYGPNKRTLRGTAAITELFTLMLLAGPDIVVSQYDACVGHRLEATDESFLSFKLLVSMTRTKVFKRIDKNKSDDQYAASKESGAVAVAEENIAREEKDASDDMGENKSDKSYPERSLKKQTTTLDSLTEKFSTFSVEPLKPQQPVEMSYNNGKIFLTLNADHKIKHIGYVFRYMSQSPVKKKK